MHWKESQNCAENKISKKVRSQNNGVYTYIISYMLVVSKSA